MPQLDTSKTCSCAITGNKTPRPSFPNVGFPEMFKTLSDWHELTTLTIQQISFNFCKPKEIFTVLHTNSM
jgi:hypothetical protein